MIDIETYLAECKAKLYQTYGERLLYMGLQGSYLHGEATEKSDVDLVVVLEEMSIADLDAYRSVVLSLAEPEKSCGFVCDKTDLLHWNPLEIWHFLNSTKDYYGKLSDLVPAYTQEDIRNFTKLSLNNLYHALCHSYIHEECEACAAMLPGAYKSVFFILQNLYHLRKGGYIPTKAQLLPLLCGKDRDVLRRSMEPGRGGKPDFQEDFALIFTWCQETMHSL